MNRLALFAVTLATFTSVFAQSASRPDAFIQARQAEVEQLAESLYSTRLDSNRWTRHDVEQCGAFAHHAFASFDAGSAPGVRFVAIYDLDHAAAHSADRPWEGGIRLLRLKASPVNQADSNQLQDALLTAFNHAVLEEKTARGAEMNPAEEAVCLLRVAGEMSEATTAVVDAGETRATKPLKVTSILIPLAASAGTKRTASVEFSPNGTIAEASVLVQRKP